MDHFEERNNKFKKYVLKKYSKNEEASLSELRKFEFDDLDNQINGMIDEYESKSLMSFDNLDKNHAFLVDSSGSVENYLGVIKAELKLFTMLLENSKEVSFYNMASKRNHQKSYGKNLSRKKVRKIDAAIEVISNDADDSDRILYGLIKALEDSSIEVINIFSDTKFYEVYEKEKKDFLKIMMNRYKKRLSKVQINIFAFTGNQAIVDVFNNKIINLGGVKGGIIKTSRNKDPSEAFSIIDEIRRYKEKIQKYLKKAARKRELDRILKTKFHSKDLPELANKLKNFLEMKGFTCDRESRIYAKKLLRIIEG